MILGPTTKAAVVRRRKLITAILAMLAVPAWAQSTRIYRDGNTWVEETTGTITPAKEFRALTDMGALQVQGTAPQVTYVVHKRSSAGSEEAARKQFEQLRVTASRVGEAVVLEGHTIGSNINRLTADFVVQIPRMTQLIKAETHGGNLSVNSLQGKVIAMTAGGNVKLDDLEGPSKVVSGGGSMDVGSVNADLYLQSGSGSITVEHVSGQLTVSTGGGKVKIGTAGPTKVETGAGNIEVMRCNGDLRAETGGGNVNLGDMMGSVSAETGGGTVRLGSAQGNVRVVTGGGMVELWKVGQGARVETGTGSITVQFVGGRNQFHDSDLHTSMGNVVVYLPRDLGVNIHASTELANGSGIHSDFPGLAITSEGGQYGPKSMFAEGPLNGGGPSLRVRTTIGQIDFKKLQ